MYIIGKWDCRNFRATDQISCPERLRLGCLSDELQWEPPWEKLLEVVTGITIMPLSYFPYTLEYLTALSVGASGNLYLVDKALDHSQELCTLTRILPSLLGTLEKISYPNTVLEKSK